MIVNVGSTITLSPLLVVIIKRRVRLYCSETNGEMLLLNMPEPGKAEVFESSVCLKFDMDHNKPNPITINATEKAPTALECSITPGTAAMIKIIWPIKAIKRATQIVLKRPRYVSAMYAPSRGVR